jgi:hypothetical protein
LSADVLFGDVNLDGEVNGLDVDPFVDVLLSGPYQIQADMNLDAVVNGLDVDPFVAAVVGGSAQEILEPRYDVTLFDGTYQARVGNPVTPPLSVNVNFLDTPLPLMDAVLEVTASGDFRNDTSNLLVFAESHLLGTLFIAGGNESTTQWLVIPHPLLNLLTADGMVGVRLEGTSGPPANVNRMIVESVRLAYTEIPEPSGFVLVVLAFGLFSLGKVLTLRVCAVP